MLLAEFFTQVYEPRRLLGRSPDTTRLYRWTFRHFARFIGKTPELEDLTPANVAGFLSRFSTCHAAPTTNKVRSQLLAIANYACKRGMLREVPDVAKVPEPRRIKTYWSIDQLTVLVASARQARGAICGLPAGDYWAAMLLVSYSTGLRARAVWNIEHSRVDLQARTIHVLAETQKQLCDQVLRITPATADAIRKIWEPPRVLLFPWNRSEKMRYYYLDRITARAGLPHGRRDKFHRMRRTTANLGVQYGAGRGFDPCRQLGHASDATTRQFYLADDLGTQAGDVLPDVPPRPNF